MELFEQYVDERGNIHVRVSQEVCVLTKEEEAAAIAKFEALKVENAKLREKRREYQATIDSLVDECTDHETEKAKLRELCRRFSEYVSYDRCEGCVTKRQCNNGEVDECWQMGEIRKLARELGIEVSDAS